MPKGKSTTIVKTNFLKVALLLAQFLLIKLGDLPLNLTTLLIKLLKKVAAFRLSYLPRPAIGLIIAPTLHHHRGRPRKKPLLEKYKLEIRRFIKNRVPKKVKFTIALGLILAIFISYSVFLLTAAYQLPSPDHLTDLDKPLTTEIYDRNGKILYRFYEGQNRTLVKLSDVPDYLKEATVAIEDKNFYKHNGIDIVAMTRAFYNNYYQHQKLQGASTITQQLIKNTLLSSEQTYTRKFKEAILAVWAETIYSKDQILGMYLNEAPYGGPTVGAQAAAQTYFGKDVQDLDLAESTYLAGLTASPTEFSPYGTNPALGKTRQKEVLQRMVEDKYITQAQADTALAEELQIKPPTTDIKAPHFVMYVKNYLAKKYGPRIVAQGGLKVYTTLDLGLQDQVQKIVAQEVNNLGSLQVGNGAAMVTDAQTGQILAMVGSKDYWNPQFGNYNLALAIRQPGSSIKPVTYVTAFKKGYTPGNTVLDAPVAFSDQWGNSYAPVNYDGTFHGPVSIRIALGSSLNIPAVKILASVGIDSMIQTARDMGITTFTNPKSYGLSLTLGGAGVKMIEMMGMYQTLAENGVYRPVTPLLKVVNSTGQVLEEYSDQGQQVVQPELAYMVTSILSDNSARTLAFGPNSLLNLPGVAVKTGTTDNKRDNWTFGYTPQFVVGVWVGNNDNSPMNPSLTSGITGAAPIWNKVMKGIIADNPPTPFIRPSGIIEVNVDGRKDIAAANILPRALVQTRYDKDKTRYFDAFSSYATSSAQAANN